MFKKILAAFIMCATIVVATIPAEAAQTLSTSTSQTEGKIKLAKTSITMKAGTTYTLKPSTDDSSDKFTYSSSKKSVATVSKSGKITALTIGTAKITVKSTSGLKATVTVKVKKVSYTLSDETYCNIGYGGKDVIMIADEDGYWAFADENAKLITGFDYKGYISPFGKAGYAVALNKEDEYCLINKKGEVLMTTQYPLYCSAEGILTIFDENYKATYKPVNGDAFVIPNVEKYNMFTRFNDGYAAFGKYYDEESNPAKDDGNIFTINTKGEITMTTVNDQSDYNRIVYLWGIQEKTVLVGTAPYGYDTFIKCDGGEKILNCNPESENAPEEFVETTYYSYDFLTGEEKYFDDGYFVGDRYDNGKMECSLYRLTDNENTRVGGIYAYMSARVGNLTLISDGEKWGFLSRSTEKEYWYDDATNFVGNYAIVGNDGKYNIVTSKLKSVSDSFKAEAAASIGKKMFSVKIDGEYHILKIK